MRLNLTALALATLALAHNDHGQGGMYSSPSPSVPSSSVVPLPLPTGTPQTGDNVTLTLTTTLTSNNFGVLSSIIVSNAQAVASLLQTGDLNQTLFAPTDQAFSDLISANLSSTPWSSLNLSDPATLLSVLSYHITDGFNTSELSNANATILSTRLTDPALVQLPNGSPQVLVIYGPRHSASAYSRFWKGQGSDSGHSSGSEGGQGSGGGASSGHGGQRIIISQLDRNITSIGSPLLVRSPSLNLTIYPISRVLLPPPSPYQLLNRPPATEFSSPSLNLSTFANALPSELQFLVNASGITVFVPTPQALRTALQIFSAQGGNGGQLGRQEAVNVFGNHFVNGSVLYSTNLTSIAYSSVNATEGGSNSSGQIVTSASGQPLSVSSNSTGTYITSANVTARIVRSDVTLANGILHVIDQVLFNTAGNLTTNGGGGATAAPSYTVTASSTSSSAQGGTTAIVGGGGAGSTSVESLSTSSSGSTTSASSTSTTSSSSAISTASSTQSSSQSTSISTSTTSVSSSASTSSSPTGASTSVSGSVTIVVVPTTVTASAAGRMVRREKGRWA